MEDYLLSKMQSSSNERSPFQNAAIQRETQKASQQLEEAEGQNDYVYEDGALYEEHYPENAEFENNESELVIFEDEN